MTADPSSHRNCRPCKDCQTMIHYGDGKAGRPAERCPACRRARRTVLMRQYRKRHRDKCEHCG